MLNVNDLPEGWEMRKLGEVCQTTSGGTPSRKETNFYNGNIPWVKSGELDKGLITDTEEKGIPSKKSGNNLDKNITLC